MHELKFIFDFSEKELKEESLEKFYQEEKKLKQRKRDIFISIPIILFIFAFIFYTLKQPENPVLTLLSAFLILCAIIMITKNSMYKNYKEVHKTNIYLLENQAWCSLAGNLNIINLVSYFAKDDIFEELRANSKNNYEADIEREDYGTFLNLKLGKGKTCFVLRNKNSVNLNEFNIVHFKRNGIFLEKEE